MVKAVQELLSDGADVMADWLQACRKNVRACQRLIKGLKLNGRPGS